MARVNCMILNGVKDHVIPHIVEKNTTKEMWDNLKTLYQGTFVQQKMLLENQLRSYQTQKGELVDPFFLRLQEIHDQLTSAGSTPDPIYGWEEMCAAHHQEEIRRMTKAGSSGKGGRIKKEEVEDATLASAGQQGKRQKKDISKVKCFHCGELGHYPS
eukprot:PITA_21256